jgi:hypothetical protein
MSEREKGGSMSPHGLAIIHAAICAIWYQANPNDKLIFAGYRRLASLMRRLLGILDSKLQTPKNLENPCFGRLFVGFIAGLFYEGLGALGEI